MQLTHRVSKLEQMHGTRPAQRPCSECGCVPDIRPTQFTLVMAGDDPGAGPDFCPTCNARLAYTLDFDDRG